MVLHGYSDAFSVEDIQYNRIKLVSFFCWVATIYRFFCECTTSALIIGAAAAERYFYAQILFSAVTCYAN